MKLFYIIAILVVAALVASPMVFLPGANDGEHEGKVVLWDTYGSAVKSIDPATCGDTTSAGIQGNLYESLYAYHFLKRPVEVVPQLAVTMPKVSKDQLTYTIQLRPSVLYHRNPCFGKDPLGEGEHATRAVRAEDFVLAFKRCADYHVNTGLAWAFLSKRIVGLDAWRKKSRGYKVGDFSRYDLPVEGLKAVDESTFQIRLTEPFPQFVYVLAMTVYAPIPREAVEYWLTAKDEGDKRVAVPVERRATEFKKPEMVVGTGAYTLKTWERKSKIVMVRNAEYRPVYYPKEGSPGDKEAGLLADAGKRVPFIDVIHLDFVEETYSSWMLFLTKQKDASGIPRETFEGVVTPDKVLAEKWRERRIYMKKYSSPAVYWIVFNMEDPILGASKSLRQAVCLAYDVENHIKVLYNGRGKRAVNIVPSTFKGHKEAGPGPYYKLDVEAAKKKIAEAKRELAAAGLLVNGEIPALKLDLGDTSAYAARQGDFTRQQFAKIGLKLKVIYNDWPTLQQKVHNKRSQMYMMGWHADYPDAENFLQLFYSPNIKKGTNNSNYSSAGFDRLYEKVRTMSDTPERSKLYTKMIRQISEDVPVVLLSEPISFVLYYDWVRNVKPHPIGYGFTQYRRIDSDLRHKLGGRR